MLPSTCLVAMSFKRQPHEALDILPWQCAQALGTPSGTAHRGRGLAPRPVAHLPPVTSRNVPVMKEASALASHRIARATSSG